MNSKTIYKIIFIISFIIFIICALMIIKLYLPENNDNDKYKTETTTVAENSQNVQSEPSIELPDNPIDFDKLKATNSDVYAWIKIPDTNIDYAVVQSGPGQSDLFYLDHNIDKQYEFAGMIFSQKQNALDFKDPVTVLYGHDMKNGSMFADLHNFEDKEFFDEHDTMFVYTPGHILTYTIVSAYVYDDRHIMNSFDFSKKKELKEYISSLTSPRSIVSNVRDGVSVTVKDKILTLSTCTSNNSQRYLVQGVLTDDELTK